MTLTLPLLIVWIAAMALLPLDGRKSWVGWLAVLGLSGSFAAVLWLAAVVLRTGPQRLVAGAWPVGVGITLRADALSVLFAALSIGLLLATLVYAVVVRIRERTFPALVLFMATGLTGLFLTGDAFNFYVFFEVAMTAAFVLASYGRRPRETRAALTFMVVNLLGSVLFLIGIAALYHVTGTLDMQGIAAWARTVERNSAILIATLIFVAFSVKLGLFPFHFWLPPVYRDSWPAVAATLSGAIANIASYGLIRFGVGILPRERELGAAALVTLGVLSIVYGAHQAVSVRKASEALAYSSISQAGYIMVALGIGGPAGYSAAILFAVVNALNKTLLFLASGLRGPLTNVAFAIGAFSVAGVPPTAGFFGKASVFLAGISAQRTLLVAWMFLGGTLAFIYMFQIYQHDFVEREHHGDTSSLAAHLVVLGLAGLIVMCGVWPEPLLAVSRQAAAVLPGGQP